MMNKQIRRMIDEIFADMKMTADNLALRDEMMANAQARFEDSVRAGKTEEEAFAEVAASLGDVQSLLHDMNAEKPAEDKENKEEKTEEKATDENGETVDVEEVKEDAGAAEGEPEDKRKTIFYVTDMQQQSQYINMFKKEGLDAVILSHNIDSPFITQMEQKNEHIKFQRIDADLTDHFKEDVSEEEKEAFKEKTDSLVEIFRKALGNDKLEVKVEKMKDENVASMITLSEESRRMQEMMKMYGMSGMDPSMFGTNATLILNANHPLVEYVVAHKDGENTEMFCHQLYDLAMLAHKPLSPEEMTEFVKRSNEIMMKLAK